MAIRRLTASVVHSATALRDVIWPRVCPVCKDALLPGEHFLCTSCNINLPRTNYHEKGYQPQNNPVIERLLDPTVPICRGTAWYHYIAGSANCQIILEAKFHNMPFLMRRAARTFAEEIKDSDFFNGIDLTMPIPIWITRLISRGYNQTEYICQGIKDITGIPMGKNLYARRPHKSQKSLNAEQRRRGLEDLFDVKHPEALTNKHILVIDDVLTTGSTLLSALKALHNSTPSATLSVLTLGCTQR